MSAKEDADFEARYEAMERERVRGLPWGDLTPEEQEKFLAWCAPNTGFNLHNLEMEQAILGALFVSNQEMLSVRDLEPKHFWEPLHAEIFEAMIEEQKQGRHFSPVTFRSMYPDIIDRYPDIDGARYLVNLASMALHVINIRDFVEHVVDLWTRRELARACIESVKALQNPGKHALRDVTSKLVGNFLDATSESAGMVKVQSFQRVQQKILERIDERNSAYSTRIGCLDKGLGGGFFSRKSYCFMARPKNGKTILMSTIFMNMAEQGIPVLYVACEMGDVEIHQRNMARKMGVPSLRFITHKQDSTFVNGVLEVSTEIGGLPGYFADAAGITFDELRMLITAATMRFGIKGFFLDYLGLVKGQDKRESKADFQERVAEWIAATCKQKDIFAAYAAQTNREGHLRGSDAAIMNADVLYEITLEQKPPQGGARHAFLTNHAHRYMPMHNIGSAETPALRLHSNGPHFKDVADLVDGNTQPVYTTEEM